MPTYITLLRYTPKGIENIKDSPSRLNKAKEVMKSAGGQLKSFYLTMGACDGICIFQAPDDAACARALLTISSQGFVKTETLRAFTEEEYRKVIGGLP